MIYTFHLLISYLRKHLYDHELKEIHTTMLTVTLCNTENQMGGLAYQSDKTSISDIILIMKQCMDDLDQPSVWSTTLICCEHFLEEGRKSCAKRCVTLTFVH